MQKKMKGFTLIELIVVMAIIAILSSLLMPALRQARIKAHEANIRATIASLKTALAMYETDFGSYPDITGSGNDIQNKDMVDQLADESTHGTNSNWNGPYFEFDEGSLVEATGVPKVENDGRLVDSFGTKYHCANEANKPSSAPSGRGIYIWSYGVDKVNNDGEDDDIHSW